jgi:hypothetical protein
MALGRRQPRGNLGAMEIDLKTRFLDRDHQVFLIHPGERKKFYEEVRAHEEIFLDIPGAALVIEDDEFYSLENIANLKLSRAIVKWHRSGAEKEKEPSRLVSDYHDQAKRFLTKRGATKGFARLAAEADALYRRAKVGDLIVVAGTSYFSNVLIGEIVRRYSSKSTARSRLYPGERIPARSIRWLSTNKKKLEFSEELIVLMQNMSAVTRLGNRDHKEEIYTAAYGQYVYADEAQLEIRIDKPKVDFKDLTDGNRFALYFASLHIAYTKNKVKEFLEIDNYDVAITKYYDPDFFLDVSIELSSPGVIYLGAKKALTVVAIGAFLALASASFSAEPDKITVVNSTQPQSECVWELEKELKNIFSHWDYGRWKKLCEQHAGATARTGLSPGVKTTPKGRDTVGKK